MKIAICYPPLDSGKGIPLLAQNRQFQWTHSPWTAYPIVPALAATLLKKAGFEVFWDDAINENLDYKTWKERILEEKPDVIVMETKTPVIKRHWQIINEIKLAFPKTKVVLMGDHVTALPQESMDNCRADYILTGGDYDFLLLSLAEHLTKGKELEPGLWFRNEEGEIVNTGKFQLNHDLNQLPFIDRDLTQWRLYAFENSNYKRVPGTYIMAGRDCWWRKDGGCKFCAWTILYPNFRVRTPENVLDEIGILIEKYQVKEIMDDTGTFPAGAWLRDFCQGMVERGYNKKINFDCNLRFGILDKKDYFLMAKAGFRFLLYGLESARQETIDRLNKGIKVAEVESELRTVKQANKETGGHLEPHVTCMVGYPWETREDAKETIDFTRRLFNQGLIDSLQATIVIPYPGTTLFKECCQEDLLKTLDWDQYDMKMPIVKTPMKDEEVMELVRSIYGSFWTPGFVFRKLKQSLVSWETFKYYCRLGAKYFSRKLDFAFFKDKGNG